MTVRTRSIGASASLVLDMLRLGAALTVLWYMPELSRVIPCTAMTTEVASAVELSGDVRM